MNLGWAGVVGACPARVAQARGHICRGSPASLGVLSFLLFLLCDAVAGFEPVCLECVPGLQLGGCSGETGGESGPP